MSLLEVAIGLLAPPQCVGCGTEGRVICKDCTDLGILPFGERCWRCNALSPGSRTCTRCYKPGSPTFVWVATDYDGLPRELLSTYKFGHQRAAAEPIAELMIATFLLNGAKQAARMDYLVVPVPTATARIRERSFGHSELLARQIALKLKTSCYHSLRRLDQTRQLGSKREDRLVQLQDSFVAKNRQKIKGRNILLVDDVVTTGGTLMAASNILRAAGARQVDALLFAKRL